MAWIKNIKCSECGKKIEPPKRSIICRECRQKIKDASRWGRKYKGNLANRLKRNERLKVKRAQIKKECFEHYGLKCVHCGESDYMSLQIDHINGGGTQHRRELGSKLIYRWLRRNDYPDGYQTLCANCNITKQLNNGVLPPNRKSLVPEIKTFSLAEYAVIGENK